MYKFRYQVSYGECVPCAIINGLSYLYEDVPPEVLKYIYQTSMDLTDDQGRLFRDGTSTESLKSVVRFLSDYKDPLKSDRKKFACNVEYLTGARVNFGAGNKIVKCLNAGGVAACCVNYDVGLQHCILLFKSIGNDLYFFDSGVFPNSELGCEVDLDRSDFERSFTGKKKSWPLEANLRMSRSYLDKEGKQYYALGNRKEREVVLMSRKDV